MLQLQEYRSPFVNLLKASALSGCFVKVQFSLCTYTEEKTSHFPWEVQRSNIYYGFGLLFIDVVVEVLVQFNSLYRVFALSIALCLRFIKQLT